MLNRSQGIGIREGHAVDEGKYEPLAPTTIYDEEEVDLIIDGVSIKLVSAVGETDDQLFVWLPEDKVLCCGDNYYGCWPNLYAIRGGQYRDIATWVDSLEKILSYPAEALLPGHTKVILGYDKVIEEIKSSLEKEEYQWAIQLCDLLMNNDSKVSEAKRFKAEGLLELSKLITSANGRHYYIACAKELAE